MSTSQKFFVLPLIAAAALMAPASSAIAECQSKAKKVEAPVAKATHHRKAKRKHHRHHAKAKAAQCMELCCSVAVAPVVQLRPLCPPDFADAWYEQAKLAWVGPTRCYPFQPNGFYPMPRFNNLRELPPGAFDDVEVVGAGGGK